MTRAHAAAWLGVSPQAVEYAVQRGHIRGSTFKRLSGASVCLVAAADVERYRLRLIARRATRRRGSDKLTKKIVKKLQKRNRKGLTHKPTTLSCGCRVLHNMYYRTTAGG